ncbi:SDR family oxidoreductase [Paraburkholderia denitrificans]|uniref:SDR family oxidoreductase n=1 Tax=Paraburkholderia denitrificans TaxID=694025 RepID=A0ABW0J7L8_9BURK
MSAPTGSRPSSGSAEAFGASVAPVTPGSDFRPGSSAGALSRVVLVTGGARRIGRELSLGFAARGWDVAVHFGGSGDAADELVTQIEALGRRAVALHADLASEADVARLVPACTAALGRPACVLNNASSFDEDTARDIGYEKLLNLMAINVGAPLVLARTLYEATPDAAAADESQRTCVINVLDQKLYNMNPDYLSYTLTKAALANATVALAQALAPKVRVVGLAPGLTLQSADQTPEGFETAHKLTPLGRASRPADLVEAALYLAGASGVTGTTLVVDGGQHLVPLPRDVMYLTGA